MNIRIVIFLILLFLPSACSGNADVWASLSSGFIKQNGSLSFENISLEVEALNNKALITVYKHQNKIDSREYNVSEFREYDGIRITLLGIEGEYAWISMSKIKNIDVWRSKGKKLLKWGERYAIENYTVEIDTFDSFGVNLNISNKSTTIKEFFSEGDVKDYDSLRIAVKEINTTGFVSLEFFTNKPEAINAKIFLDKQEYFPDETPVISIYLSSKSVQNIVGIVIDSTPPVLLQPKVFSVSGLKGRRIYTSRMNNLPVNSTVTINAKIITLDYYNNYVVTTLSKNIFITPVVGIKKIAPLDTDEEKITIMLKLYNSGKDNVSIHIQDTIPEELGLKYLSWDVTLKGKNSTNITYVIQPKKPGIYTLPPAIAQWNNHVSLSKEVKIRVHMPYISMIKTIEQNASNTDVVLDISNTGDRPAMVMVTDDVQGYSVLNGNTTWSGLLEAGKRITLKYTIDGNVDSLPAAKAVYRDIHGVVREAFSNPAKPAKDMLLSNVKPYVIIISMLMLLLIMTGIISTLALIAYLAARKGE